MAALAPAEMALRAASPSLFTRQGNPDRPTSQASDHIYTEFEDEDDVSDMSHQSLKSSNESYEERRRSDTTVSSYNDVETPQTDHGQFELLIKPVQGPQGPHLFRSSQASADLMFDFALQLSPLDLKTPPPRPDTAVSTRTAQPHRLSRRSLPPVFVNIPGLPANIHDWTSHNVTEWLFNAEMDMTIIDSFQENDISGTVLYDMKAEDLKDLGIQSFGKRHHLWAAIADLKGGNAGPSPVPTPFQDIPVQSPIDIDDFEFPRSACSSTSLEDLTPVDESVPRKKKSRRHRRRQHSKTEQIDLGRMSFLAVEETLPEEHVCDKGHECPKWKKWNRRVEKARNFNETLRISGGDGTGITYTTSQSSGKTVTACNAVRTPRTTQVRPISGVPSVVASSDVLGPAHIPDFALHAESLQQIGKRDPQENVKNFLRLQNVSSPIETPQPPSFSPVEPQEAAQPAFTAETPMYHEEPAFDMFPATYYQPLYSPAQGPSQIPTPHENLRSLPRLAIPRAATASPSLARRQNSIRSPVSALSQTLSLPFSPVSALRASTPASELDVPTSAPAMGPPIRDFSQSVPPNMQYREQSSLSRSASRAEWRRPSFAMPSLAEDPETPKALSRHTTVRRNSDESSEVSSALQKTQEMYGLDCTHAGWMRKRRTKLLRHDWQESHFRLNGTQLAMHANNRQTSKAKDTINVDDYTVNCSSQASNSKLSAALKTFRIRNDTAAPRDPASFAFQLVPELEKGKTHHFAVGNREERIDWMRELMLAKAKGQRGKGYDVQVNGR